MRSRSSHLSAVDNIGHRQNSLLKNFAHQVTFRKMLDIKIYAEPLNIYSCIDWVRTDESGGIDVFIGTVRNSTKGKRVVQLEFEAYGIMALNEMRKIAEQMLDRWPLHKVAIHHRTGILNVGD